MTLADDIVDLNDSTFESAVKSSARLIVDCWAPWCGPCRMLAPTIEAMANDYGGRIAFAKLDTDESPKTAMSLGIYSIPTILFYKDGEQVERLTGTHPRQNIEAVIKKHSMG